MTTLHSLSGILVAIDEAIPDDPPPMLTNFLDQQGARAAEELAEYFDVDLADEETARVVGATVIYLTNRGRETAGGVTFPVTAQDAIYTWHGVAQGLYGVCGQIQQRHGKAKGEARQ